MKHWLLVSIITCMAITISCDSDEGIPDEEPQGFFSEFDSRNFKMGFTSWSYGPNQEDVDDTYDFLSLNGDIYTEHVDNQIPWDAWINDTQLPASFVNEIAFRKSNKIEDQDMLLSVSILNLNRNDLAEDFDGSTPGYNAINDPEIVDAYGKHIDYLVAELDPDYLVIAIEANELLLHSEEKWNQYKLLISEVKSEIATKYPSLRISESITLHNLFEPQVSDPESYIDELVTHMNTMDFVAISHYPFFKNHHTQEEFQATFDFLHSQITRPIAFVETAHLAEDLSVEGLNLFITGNPTEQDTYLQTLLLNAQQNDYEFVIWWAHRDFDELWNTFPEEVKDLGKLWRDTGLLDESGTQRAAFESWSNAFDLSLISAD